MERRLAAILAADVVGYSRLMEADDAGTLVALRARQKEVIEPLLARHHGRIFKQMGDGVLAEFTSAVNAVECAVALQQGMSERNASLPNDKQILLRISINLGDVLVEDDDLFGDGVNLAARLQAIADPGQICLSGKVRDEVARKLHLNFDDLGDQELKNISTPVRVYRVRTEMAGIIPGRLALPDKPSIAVLPFDNLSGDPQQQYFSDGITEDIITELSRFRWLFVIAQNSSFQFRGKVANIQQIGRGLGVRYVLEGSIRRSGGRIRITAQLIDAATGAHVWADRYDRDYDDIFAIQDEVAKSIVVALLGRVEVAMADHIRRKPTADLTAYDYLLRGEAYIRQNGFSDRDALTMFKKALELDPHCARAHVRIAFSHAYDAFRWSTPVEESARLARQHAERALALDDGDASAHAAAAWAYLLSGQFDLADSHSQRAVLLNPNDWYAVRLRGSVLNYLGDRARAIESILLAMRLDPLHPATKLESLIDAYYMSQQYTKALEAFRLWQNPPAHMWLEAAAIHAQLGQIDEARAARKRYAEERPEGHTEAGYVATHMRLCKVPADRELWLEGYRTAGLTV